MKKKLVAIALCACLAATSVVGCGDKKSSKGDSVDVTTMTADEIREVVLKDVEDYATVGDYLGVEVEVAPVAEVTEGAIEAECKSWLEFYPFAFSGVKAVSGDAINIDYVGTIDGVAFEGGTAKASDYDLGSKVFIDDFDEQMEGMTPGETKEVNVTFPAEYKTADLAGKDAVFTVTLNYVKLKEGVPEMTDQWVSRVVELEEISDMVDELNVAGFREFVKGDLQQSAEDKQASEIVQAVLDKVIEGSKFDNVPDKLKEEFIKEEREYQESYIKSSFNMELEEYLEAVEVDMDTFEKDVEQSAIDYMQDVIAIKIIAIKEDIKVTQEEYDEYLKTYSEYYGCETVEEFEEQYASEYGTDLFEGLLLESTLQYLKDNAKVTEVAATGSAE